MKTRVPTLQEQVDHWNKVEGEELERVSQLEENDSDFYEVNDEPEPGPYRLREEGQTFDGEGESYAERNL